MRLPKSIQFAISLLLLFGTVAFPISVAQDEGLTVDAGEVLVEISPYVYGANMGPFAVSPDLFTEAEESGITFLRFPNGDWGDLNNLQHFHIDLYMTMVNLIGAEPSIQVRLENGTPDAAAELVHYTNIEKDYGVRYWYVGNEPNLYSEDYTTEDHTVQWRAIAEAMLDVDPSIQLIGPGITLTIESDDPRQLVDQPDSLGKGWMTEFLKANGDLVDVVSIHRYVLGSQSGTTVDDSRGTLAGWDPLLPALRELVDEVTGRDDLAIAITEFNSHASPSVGGEAANDSFFNALWIADIVGRSLRYDPFTLAYFEFVTVSHRGGYGLLADFNVRPSYYTYQLYQRFGQQLVASESDIEFLSIYGALRDDGALTLIAVNLNDDEVSTSVAINNFDGDVASTRLLTEEVLAEEVENTFLIDGVLTLPGRSAVLFVLK